MKEFAPENAKTLCVVGTGVIAKLVVEYCRPLFSAGAGAELVVVSRSAEAATKFGNFAAGFGWKLAGDSAAEGRSRADVVVTCTPATTPVVPAVRKGACVVALGADGAGKRELGPGVLSGDVLLLVDSAAQCLRYGEAAYKGNKVTCTELGAYFCRADIPWTGHGAAVAATWIFQPRRGDADVKFDRDPRVQVLRRADAAKARADGRLRPHGRRGAGRRHRDNGPRRRRQARLGLDVFLRAAGRGLTKRSRARKTLYRSPPVTRR